MRSLLFLTILLVAGLLRGQEASPSGPPDPLIAQSMPAYSCWSASYTYAGSEINEAAMAAGYTESMRQMAVNNPILSSALAANPALLVRPSNIKERVITKTGNIRSEILLYTNGRRGERWHFGTDIVTRDSVTQKLSLEMGDSAKDEKEFPEFAWLSRRNFTGIRVVQGKKCLVFQDKVEPLQIENPRLFLLTHGSSDPDAKVPATAIVDIDSRLPVSVECKNQTQTYLFLPPPTAVLTVPSDFLAVAQESERRTKIRNAPLSPP